MATSALTERKEDNDEPIPPYRYRSNRLVRCRALSTYGGARSVRHEGCAIRRRRNRRSRHRHRFGWLGDLGTRAYLYRRGPLCRRRDLTARPCPLSFTSPTSCPLIPGSLHQYRRARPRSVPRIRDIPPSPPMGSGTRLPLLVVHPGVGGEDGKPFGSISTQHLGLPV
jgi:hypothetical protein